MLESGCMPLFRLLPLATAAIRGAGSFSILSYLMGSRSAIGRGERIRKERPREFGRMPLLRLLVLAIPAVRRAGPDSIMN
jgi:hypothetical protein